jgi:hypothetical protein
MHLSDADRFLLLATCGVQRRVQGAAPSPVTGVVANGFVGASGASALFVASSLTGAAGQYRLCWCAAGAPCSTSEQYAVDVGELLVRGPTPSEANTKTDTARTCVAGTTCTITDLTGFALDAADRYHLLDTCGVAPEPHERFFG